MNPDAGLPDRGAAGRFELRLLGGFDLRDADGEPLDLPTRKARLLLAYLAMPAGRAHGRDKLANLLWGERQDEQARGSLRHALAAMRAGLGSEPLRTEREQVALDPEYFLIDADQLAAIAAGDGALGEDRLCGLYRGDFLDGISPEGVEFCDWLTFERTRCRNLAQSAFQKASDALAKEGRNTEAIALAERLLALDPLREQSHRLLMRLFFAAGERSQALAQFHQCKELLAKELAVDPSVQTSALAREIQDSREDAPSVPQPAATASRQSRAGTPPGGGHAFDKKSFTISLAVLPFANMSGQPGEQHIAEGFSEDLITEISRLRDFSVIAHQSSHLFSPHPGTAASAATELGVRYALTGGIRRSEDRLRVTAQLIDSAGSRYVWAERYDRRVKDLFAVQDEIVAQIIGNLDAQVRRVERERASRARPDNLDAWELTHRAFWHTYRFTPSDTAAAKTLFERAIGQSPDFALPHAGLAYTALVESAFHFVDDPTPVIAAGLGHAEQAVALDDADAFCHVVLGRLSTLSGDLPRALHHLSLARELNPGFAQAYFGLGQALVWLGRPAEAIAEIDRALRLSPKDPLASMFLTLRSFCQYWLHDYAEAFASAQRATQLHARESWARLALAIAAQAQGRHEEATRSIAEALRLDPKLTIASFDALVRHVPDEMRKQVYAGLRLAGLGEG